MKKLLFWFAVFSMSMLVMVQPARADTIPATGTLTSRYCLIANGWCVSSTRFTKSEVCSWLDSVWPSNAPYSVVNTGGIYGYGVCDSAKVGATDIDISLTTSAVVYSCPVDYSLDAGGTTCTSNPPACPAADTLHSQGFFNLGTTPNGSIPSTPCVNGCALKTTGGVYTPGQNLYLSATPKFKQVLNGKNYYFAEASYWHTGQSCSPDTPNFLADFVGSKPDMTCQEGQQMITMGGVTKCFNSDGTAADLNSASAVAEAKTLADAKIAKVIQDARDAVAAAGGSASDVAAAGTVAAGVSAAGGSGSSNPDSVDAAFCADNPTASMCVEQDFGSVEDSSLEEKTINVAITPVAVGGAGSCPAPSSMILHGQQYWFQWTTYCNFATGIKPILLAFAWLSAAGLLIGGFKTA